MFRANIIGFAILGLSCALALASGKPDQIQKVPDLTASPDLEGNIVKPYELVEDQHIYTVSSVRLNKEFRYALIPEYVAALEDSHGHTRLIPLCENSVAENFSQSEKTYPHDSIEVHTLGADKNECVTDIKLKSQAQDIHLMENANTMIAILNAGSVEEVKLCDKLNSHDLNLADFTRKVHGEMGTEDSLFSLQYNVAHSCVDHILPSLL